MLKKILIKYAALNEEDAKEILNASKILIALTFVFIALTFVFTLFFITIFKIIELFQ